MSVPQPFLKLPAVVSLVQKSRAAIYLAIKKNEFPAPIKNGSGRSVVWLASDIAEWQESCIKASKAS